MAYISSSVLATLFSIQPIYTEAKIDHSFYEASGANAGEKYPIGLTHTVACTTSRAITKVPNDTLERPDLEWKFS